MSISTPKLQNPCKKFIEYKGDTGIFQYWDKERINAKSGKPGENVILPSGFKFIVLDELCTISGYNEPLRTGIYSNEVHSIENQILHVRSFKGGLKLVGKYNDIKADIKSAHGKFTKSVYIGLIKGDELELANIKMSGASFSSWLEKTADTNNSIFFASKFEDKKKGKVEYKVPIWESEPITKAFLDKAIELDGELQEFLKAKKELDKQGIVTSEGSQPDDDDDEPHVKNEESQHEDSDSDIPF